MSLNTFFFELNGEKIVCFFNKSLMKQKTEDITQKDYNRRKTKDQRRRRKYKIQCPESTTWGYNHSKEHFHNSKNQPCLQILLITLDTINSTKIFDYIKGE